MEVTVLLKIQMRYRDCSYMPRGHSIFWEKFVLVAGFGGGGLVFHAHICAWLFFLLRFPEGPVFFSTSTSQHSPEKQNQEDIFLLHSVFSKIFPKSYSLPLSPSLYVHLWIFLAIMCRSSFVIIQLALLVWSSEKQKDSESLNQGVCVTDFYNVVW